MGTAGATGRRVSFFSGFKRRKLFHWVAAYLAGAWVVLQVAQLFSDVFAWPASVTRILVVLLGIGFAAAIVVAWYHGERGVQRVRPLELLVFAALAVIGAVSLPLATRPLEPERPVPDARAVDPRSIAVLPFANMSSDPGNEYFTSGFHEELIATIARVPRLTVISRTSVMGYRNSSKNLRQIAAELGVARIVEGSVRKEGDRIRVTTQLIDAATDQHLWAESYEREVGDVFALQAELAQRISGALEASLTPQQKARIERPATINKQAYDLYLRARALDSQNPDSASLLYRRAVELDTAFAAAYTALSWDIARRADVGVIGTELVDSGIALARRALRMQPDYAPAYRMIGLHLRQLGRLRESTAALRRALDLDPQYGAAMGSMAVNEALGGQLDEAILWTLQAMRLDPRELRWPVNLGEFYSGLELDSAAEWAFARADSLRTSPAPEIDLYRARLELMRGRWARARAIAARLTGSNASVDADRNARADLPRLQNTEALLTALEVACATGQWTAARRYAEMLHARNSNMTENGRASSRLYLALALRKTGDVSASEPLLARELAVNSAAIKAGAEIFEYPARIAAVHALRGEVPAALQWLTRSHVAGGGGARETAVSPFFESLRGERGFITLLEQMRLRERSMADRLTALEKVRRPRP